MHHSGLTTSLSGDVCNALTGSLFVAMAHQMIVMSEFLKHVFINELDNAKSHLYSDLKIIKQLQ